MACKAAEAGVLRTVNFKFLALAILASYGAKYKRVMINWMKFCSLSSPQRMNNGSLRSLNFKF